MSATRHREVWYGIYHTIDIVYIVLYIIYYCIGMVCMVLLYHTILLLWYPSLTDRFFLYTVFTYVEVEHLTCPAEVVLGARTKY